MTKEKLTLEKILDNTPEEIEVPEYGTVIVKCPTTRDKFDAKREAKKLTEGLSPDETLTEEIKLLALKMLVEPKLSLKDYLDGNDVSLSILLDAVHMWYAKKIKDINEKRENELKSFLEQMKEK